MESKLHKEERNCGLSSDANKLHSLRYLLILLLLQVLLRPGEFYDALSELIICCKKAFADPDDLGSCGEDELESDAAPELMDVLVDTLLSLLPQSSAPTQSAIEQIIKKDLTPARHQEVGSEDDDAGDDDLLGIEEDEDIDEAETSETAESDEQSEDSEAVIGSEGAGQEFPEDSNDSGGGMDDNAMFHMDTYLAQILKEEKNQAGGETAQSQLILFKLRVLSLLEIYLHENRVICQSTYYRR